MKKVLFTIVALVFIMQGVFAQTQTKEELKAMRATKMEQLKAIQGEVDGITKQIKEYPGWNFGSVGIIGLDLSGNKDWAAIGDPDSRGNSLGFNVTGFANNYSDKYFWTNLLTFNFKRTQARSNGASETVENTTDALDLTSLGGYRLNDKWAISAEAKYTSSLLDLNDPGKLLVSMGMTWTPIQNMVVNIHPLGYEKNWPGELVSNPGAKIGAIYANEIIPGVAWTTNLNIFLPYGGGTSTLVDPNGVRADQVNDYSSGDLFNWTWINGFTFSVFKGIGVGANIGLRGDRQLADKWRYENFDENEAFDIIDRGSSNPVQFYYTLGLAYTI